MDVNKLELGPSDGRAILADLGVDTTDVPEIDLTLKLVMRLSMGRGRGPGQRAKKVLVGMVKNIRHKQMVSEILEGRPFLIVALD